MGASAGRAGRGVVRATGGATGGGASAQAPRLARRRHVNNLMVDASFMAYVGDSGR
jgi:hypothetical protein